MIRSPWLRVRCMRLDALFGLGFPPAPGLLSLGLAAHRDSQAYSTKDTPPPSRAVTSCRSMVSGSLSLPSPGFFSPFPHGTRPLSVAAQYLALDRGRPGFRRGFTCPAVLRNPQEVRRRFGYADLTLSVPPSHAVPLRRGLVLPRCGPTTPLLAVWAPPSSLAATGGISVDFLSRATQMVHFARSVLRALFRSGADARLAARGLPHSAVRGSQDMCSSPRLIAACHGLHRPAAP